MGWDGWDWVWDGHLCVGRGKERLKILINYISRNRSIFTFNTYVSFSRVSLNPVEPFQSLLCNVSAEPSINISFTQSSKICTFIWKSLFVQGFIWRRWERGGTSPPISGTESKTKTKVIVIRKPSWDVGTLWIPIIVALFCGFISSTCKRDRVQDQGGWSWYGNPLLWVPSVVGTLWSPGPRKTSWDVGTLSIPIIVALFCGLMISSCVIYLCCRFACLRMSTLLKRCRCFPRGNPSPTQMKFPETQNLEGWGQFRGRRGWISKYLPSFGGVRTFSHHQSFYREWIRKSFPVGRAWLIVLKSILPCWWWENG